jgi:hypothetical protein
MISRFFFVVLLSSVLAACGGGDGGGSSNGTTPSVVVAPPVVTVSTVTTTKAQYVPMSVVTSIAQLRLSSNVTVTCDQLTVTESGTYTVPANIYLRVDGKDLEVKVGGNQISFSPISLNSTPQTVELLAAINGKDTEKRDFTVKDLRCSTGSVKGLPIQTDTVNVTSSVAPKVSMLYGLLKGGYLTTISVQNDFYSTVSVTPTTISLDIKTWLTTKTSVDGFICLREVGSLAPCGGNGTTKKQSIISPGGKFTFQLAEIQSLRAIPYSAYTEYEVYLDGSPLWSEGDQVDIQLTRLGVKVGNIPITTLYDDSNKVMIYVYK